MLPILLVQTRADDDVAANELEAVARLGGFRPGELVSMRLEQRAGREPLDWEGVLDAHSAVILGGSPFTTTDPQDSKEPLQVAVELELGRMLDALVPRDHPFLGACYGISTLGIHEGGTVDRTYGEPASAVEIALTAEGREDPLLAGLPERFEAFVGHKEAMSALPPDAVLLARGEACPHQMFRIGRNMYATQFHPELDTDGLLYRMEKYRDKGYFEPDEFDSIAREVRRADVSSACAVLAAFRERFLRSAPGPRSLGG